MPREMRDESHNFTELLRGWQAGDPAACDRLITALYDELRRIARNQLRGEAAGHTLQPTAVVNEALLRLASAAPDVVDRAHFLALCAGTMRRVLIDHGRAARSQKRGGERIRVTLTDSLADPVSAFDILALEEVLGRLEDRDPQKATVFELWFFGGLTGAQIAEATGLSPAKVHRELTFAKAWLTDELED